MRESSKKFFVVWLATNRHIDNYAVMSTFAQRLAAGELILIDGATGTDIERRGVPMVQNAWCGASHLTHPDDVLAVHIDHIQAGAQLIVANTYASSRHLLAYADMDEHFEELNRVGVELAIKARDMTGASDIVIAGSMSTSTQGGEFPPIEVARANFLDQGRILADAGAQVLLLEMMRDLEQTQACLDGALATGLPVWLGLSCYLDDGEPWMWAGTATLEQFMQQFADSPVEVMSIMHTETEDVDACLDIVEQHWSGPIGVYAQSGVFEHPVWVFIDVISPEDYAAACAGWIERGVQVIGGCCGIGHEHIAHLRTRFT